MSPVQRSPRPAPWPPPRPCARRSSARDRAVPGESPAGRPRAPETYGWQNPPLPLWEIGLPTRSLRMAARLSGLGPEPRATRNCCRMRSTAARCCGSTAAASACARCRRRASRGRERRRARSTPSGQPRAGARSMPDIGTLVQFGPVPRINLGDLIDPSRDARKTRLEIPVRAVFDATRGPGLQGLVASSRACRTPRGRARTDPSLRSHRPPACSMAAARSPTCSTSRRAAVPRNAAAARVQRPHPRMIPSANCRAFFRHRINP